MSVPPEQRLSNLRDEIIASYNAAPGDIRHVIAIGLKHGQLLSDAVAGESWYQNLCGSLPPGVEVAQEHWVGVTPEPTHDTPRLCCFFLCRPEERAALDRFLGQIGDLVGPRGGDRRHGGLVYEYLSARSAAGHPPVPWLRGAYSTGYDPQKDEVTWAPLVPAGMYDHWLLYCHYLAWDHPDLVTYTPQTTLCPSDGMRTGPNPFESRVALESWSKGELLRETRTQGRVGVKPGIYCSTLSADVRVCTARAIDALLATGGQEAGPEPVRLTVDVPTKTVTFDGKSYTFNHANLFYFFKELYDANYAIVRSADIRKEPGCRGRIDFLRKGVPSELGPIIESLPGPGGGYWLQLPDTKKMRDST
jgi:hypothetical protein